jgi:hypothetical protein
MDEPTAKLTIKQCSLGGTNSGRKWKNNAKAVQFANETYGSKIAAGDNTTSALTAARNRLQKEFGKRPGENTVARMVGFEFCFALIGLLLPILLSGPGRLSIGRFFLPKSSRTGKPVIALE